MIVIADAERAQAIAGVMGGQRQRSHRRDDRHLSRGRGLQSRARSAPRGARSACRPTRAIASSAASTSTRFRRSLDYARAAHHARWPAEFRGAVRSISIRCRSVRSRSRFELARVARLLGEPVDAREVERSSQVRRIQDRAAKRRTSLKVSPPSWRHDVTARGRSGRGDRAAARLRHVLVGAASVPRRARFPIRRSCRDQARARMRSSGAGLLEARPMPFVAGGKGAHVRVTNPLAENEAYLRGDLLDDARAARRVQPRAHAGRRAAVRDRHRVLRRRDAGELPGPKKAGFRARRCMWRRW